MLHPGPVLPSSVCFLLINDDTWPSKALAGHKNQKKKKRKISDNETGNWRVHIKNGWPQEAGGTTMGKACFVSILVVIPHRSLI